MSRIFVMAALAVLTDLAVRSVIPDTPSGNLAAIAVGVVVLGLVATAMRRWYQRRIDEAEARGVRRAAEYIRRDG